MEQRQKQEMAIFFKSFNRSYQEICQGRQTGASHEGNKDLGREWGRSGGWAGSSRSLAFTQNNFFFLIPS